MEYNEDHDEWQRTKKRKFHRPAASVVAEADDPALGEEDEITTTRFIGDLRKRIRDRNAASALALPAALEPMASAEALPAPEAAVAVPAAAAAAAVAAPGKRGKRIRGKSSDTLPAPEAAVAVPAAAVAELSASASAAVAVAAEPAHVYVAPHVNPYTCETLPKMSRIMLSALSDLDCPVEEKETFAAWWARTTEATYKCRKKEFDSVGFLVKMLVDKVTAKSREKRR